MSLIGQLADRMSGGRLTKRDFESRFARYMADEQRVDGDGEALVDAFLKSGGEWLTDAAAQVPAAHPKYDFSAARDVLGLWRDPGSFDRALGQLTSDGYAILDVRIPPDIVAELSAYFATAPCILKSDTASLAAGETVTVDFDNPISERYDITPAATISNATVRSLALDRGLLEIAQEYCGSAPIIDIILSWFSFPSSYASHHAAQLFHFDLDRIRWLKVFLLLTDQDAETGAHMYIPGTQRDHGIDKELLKKGYARLEDDDVARYHPRETWKTMEAASGVILLEDTRGLHKGLPLVRDHRLMLQFEYTASLFGHPAALEYMPYEPIEDPYWNQMKAEYPRLFAALHS